MKLLRKHFNGNVRINVVLQSITFNGTCLEENEETRLHDFKLIKVASNKMPLNFINES